MITLTIDNYKNELEQVLLLLLRLAFKRRMTAADLVALAALDVTAIADGDLCYVTSQSAVYLYSRFSGATPVSPTVIAPGIVPPQYPGAVWLQTSIPATFGPNWRAPLSGVTSGVLREVELFTGQGSEDEKLERVSAATPSMLIECSDELVKPLSCGYPGSNYRIDTTYTMTVFSDNNRAAPSSSWGSPPSLNETTDPGPAVIVGLARKVLAGLSGNDLGLFGVDRIELGASRLVDEKYAERFLVWEADFKVILYIEIPDEDLDALVLDIQPNLADSPHAGRFDPRNYVASGYEIASPQNTLTATPTAGVAMIAGLGVASTPGAYTFASFADTYRDLNPDGSITYTAVAAGHPAPAQAAGSLRLAYTTTDQSTIVTDTWLCSYSQQFRAAYQIYP